MYTHQISYESTNNHLGRVHHTFRTTEDAVQMHMDTLKAREEAGAVTNITMHKLSFPVPGDKLEHYTLHDVTSGDTGRVSTKVLGPFGAALGNFTYHSDALLLAEELDYAYKRQQAKKQYGGQRAWYGSLSGHQKQRFNDRAEDAQRRREASAGTEAAPPIDAEQTGDFDPAQSLRYEGTAPWGKGTRSNGQPLDTEE